MNGKKLGAIFSVAMILLLCVVAAEDVVNLENHGNGNVDITTLPIEEIHGTFVCDPSNMNELVGLVDYVFVGKVLSNNGPQYKDFLTSENGSGEPIEIGIPHTSYTVQVISNIKGQLKTDEPIEVMKFGGVSQDQTAVWLFEGDLLPEENQTYVFLTMGQPDGSLLISGPNSNVPFDTAEPYSDGLKENSLLYNAYADAYEHEIIPIERERFVSIYED